MAVRRIALTGTRGHWSTVTRELADPPLASQVQVVAVCDGGDTAKPLLEWCEKHGQKPAVETDHAAMLDRHKPDAVVVCGPFESHAQQTIDAIERGIHVLTEKPAATTLNDLERLKAAVAKHPQVHLAGMMFSRYDPGFYTAHSLVRGGSIGDVRLLNARKSYRYGKRAAYYHDRATYGGTIPWVGSHAIDWVMWFAGDAAPFESVFATHSAGETSMERTAACCFTLKGGLGATVSVDVYRPENAPTHGDDWARVVGTAGVLEVRPDSIKLINKDNDGSKPVPVACDRRPFRDFLDHVDGKAKSILDAQQTLALTEACLLATQSADENRAIAFP